MANTATLTPYTDGAPCPRVLVNMATVPTGTATATLHRVYDDSDLTVPGVSRVPATAGFVATDYYPPLRTETRYYVEFFDGAGQLLSLSDSSYTTVMTAPGESWLSSPFDPSLSVAVDMGEDAGGDLQLDLVGEVHQIGGRKIALIESGYGLTKIPMPFWTSTVDDFRAAMDVYLDGVGLVVYRTPPPMEVPRVLYGYGVPSASETNLPKGVEDFLFSVTVEEVAPPTSALIASQRPYRIYTAAFATYGAFKAAYGTYRAAQLDPPADNG